MQGKVPLIRSLTITGRSIAVLIAAHWYAVTDRENESPVLMAVRGRRITRDRFSVNPLLFVRCL
ncbi:hypothetical protein RBSWK_02896 [Rhodopirellula baltica SWK14]|uniref:Uncharacterized protein n=1 Tax=Rhodopirellula baltica SWK14 TaxID=993516 RepID=L7CGT9_RHOBT|nr:hypothetical protein RBSWK_02896 [Rhodopirellula baltica SWK14]